MPGPLKRLAQGDSRDQNRMKNVAIVYFSSGGHTQQLAHGIAEGVRSVPQTAAVLWRIEGSDLRDGRWKNEEILAGLQRSDTIVFGTPTYMGGIAAQYKAFIDACGGEGCAPASGRQQGCGGPWLGAPRELGSIATACW